MNYYFLFAWRNLWRNKRRTVLAISSVLFAVLFAILFRSVSAGQHDAMIRMSVSMYTGHLQVQGKGYWDERSFDESIELTERLRFLLNNDHRISLINPRIESVVLISHSMETRITPIMGIDPEAEHTMSGLRNKVIQGRYLTSTSKGVLISSGLAERLRVGVGDSVVLFGQGYQGATAAIEVPIEGIVEFPFPKLNNAMVYLSLAQAQELFNALGRLTGVIVMIDDPKQLMTIQKDLSAHVDPNLTVMNWEEMTPEIVQAIQADVASEMIIMFILYLIIGFGVFGTVMMMTIERTHEFGLLIALGMKRGRLLLVTAIEALMVSMTGAIIGTIATFPLLYYFYKNPIMLSGELARVYTTYGIEPVIPVSIDPSVFIIQSAVVFVIAIIVSMYPLLFIRKIRPVSALQGRGGFK